MINKKAFFAGLISGLLAPVITFLVIYAVKFGDSEVDISGFISVAIAQGVFSAFIALSLLSNLALFFLFLQRQNDWASRGVVLSTLLFGVLIIYFKFLS